MSDLVRGTRPPTEPWCLRATHLDRDALSRSESLFALANGYLGWRGTLDEGEPTGSPGVYLNGMFELRPMHQAEAGFGYPEAGQTIVPVTDGTLVRLTVDGDPLDVRTGTLHHHEQVLDLRAGLLTRTLDWTPPSGSRVRVVSRRMVSLTHRHLGAVRWTVTAVGGPVRVVVQSELVANRPAARGVSDPRMAAVLVDPLVAQAHRQDDDGIRLLHRTRGSRLRVAVGTREEVSGPPGTRTDVSCAPDLGRATTSAVLVDGAMLELTKVVGHAWSAMRSGPAVLDQVDAALTVGWAAGWDGLLAEQRAYLDAFWLRADVVLEGDPELQQALRFSLFQMLQAGACTQSRAVGAKGLTGSGYDGHTFWDNEIYVLPVLNHVLPAAAGEALRWRHATLGLAKARARELGLRGAAFPWRTIRGEECSGYWPAGTAAFHIGADIADAVLRHVRATGDTDLESGVGVDLVVETARLWASLGHHDDRGVFRIEGVTGPDEYSALVDNNVYTNLMARQNLRAAVDLVQRYPDRASGLEVTVEEVITWEAAAAAMLVPYDETRGVHPQDDAFLAHERWDFGATPVGHYPLMLHHHYVELYRHQVVKQADLVLAMMLCGDAFTPAQKARNVAYYEPLTVRDSSLSSAPQAVLAAEVGHLRLAHAYLGEACLLDLHDLHGTTGDGLHLAALAGAWTAVVVGFGGLRDGAGPLALAPRLPPGTTRLAFGVSVAGHRLLVDVTAQQTLYTLASGPPVVVLEHGRRVTLRAGTALTRPPWDGHDVRGPSQPAGRAPATR